MVGKIALFVIVILVTANQEMSSPTTTTTTTAAANPSWPTTATVWDRIQHDAMAKLLWKDMEELRRLAADPRTPPAEIAFRIRMIRKFRRYQFLEVRLEELGTSETGLQELLKKHQKLHERWRRKK